jgi:hypothetical protein
MKAKPVIVSEFGESLSHYPSNYKEPDDSQTLSTCVGVHSCNGWVDRHNVSKTHMALNCRRCGWRVVLPQTIETFADLRAYFFPFQPTEEHRGLSLAEQEANDTPPLA